MATENPWADLVYGLLEGCFLIATGGGREAVATFDSVAARPSRWALRSWRPGPARPPAWVRCRPTASMPSGGPSVATSWPVRWLPGGLRPVAAGGGGRPGRLELARGSGGARARRSRPHGRPRGSAPHVVVSGPASGTGLSAKHTGVQSVPRSRRRRVVARDCSRATWPGRDRCPLPRPILPPCVRARGRWRPWPGPGSGPCCTTWPCRRGRTSTGTCCVRRCGQTRSPERRHAGCRSPSPLCVS